MDNYIFPSVKIELPDYISKIMNMLQAKGYEAYIIGGCVRDFIMGREPSDFDMATNATPDEMLSVFEEFKVIKTGIKHGTLTVFYEKDSVEITTYRIDGEYFDSRHPDGVSFTRSLREDADRRDFTINAIAYNEKTGIVDYHDGLSDIKEKSIRAVGEADKRFKEDALRILRALRFSSTLGFDIEKETLKAARKNAKLLQNISAERILVEINKLFLGRNAREVVERNSDILSFVSEILFNSAERKLNKLEGFTENLSIIYTILLNDSSFFDAEEELTKLKFSNSDKKRILSLLRLVKKDIPENKIELKKLISEAEKDLFYDYFEYYNLIGANIEELRENFEQICKNEECCFIGELDINGTDIVNLGIKDGKKIGEILKQVLDAVICEKTANKKEELIRYIKENNYFELSD